MKTQPIRPARIDFDDRGLPLLPDFSGRGPPAVHALAQAHRVYLHGCGLPQRWAGRAHFTVLELGFGLGLNFLATWQAWKRDPQRPRWLHVVVLDPHPPALDDLARAHAAVVPPELQQQAAALHAAWPAATANLHVLDLDGGAVRLMLGWGEVDTLLPALRLQADACYVNSWATQASTDSRTDTRPAAEQAARDPHRLMQALARRVSAGATVASASASQALREALSAAGFAVQRTSDATSTSTSAEGFTTAWFAPRFMPAPLPTVLHTPALPGSAALVVGGGIAGACAAQALAALGLHVTVLDRHAAPAAEASGNPAGLFHGTVNPDDGPYARLFRAAALQARTSVLAAMAAGVPASTAGLLRLQALEGTPEQTLAAMQALLQRLGLPAAYVQAVSAHQAADLAGVPLPAPAWHYPGGGWVAPAPWVRSLLAHPGVRWCGGVQVQRLQQQPDGSWQARDADGHVLAEAPLLVVAAGAAGGALLEPWGGGSWPLRITRGQVSGWAGSTPLRLAVAGDGYALPLAGALWCGATRQAVPLETFSGAEPGPGAATALEPPVHDADHAHNLQRLQRLTGLLPPPGAPLLGRAGLRLHTDDRLPLAGGLPWPQAPLPRLRAALAPRVPGLLVLGALGARGLTLAPLLARLLAAQATGTPWPLEQDLADALDPVRWWLRVSRRGGS